MTFKRLNFNWKRANKGQSLVELTLVLVILLTLFAGMVEFGNLLNQYITVVDAAREGARFASNDEPFIRTVTVDCAVPYCLRANFFTNIDDIIEGPWTGDDPPLRANKGALSPLRLRSDVGDDVVISFFSINNGTLLRFSSSHLLGDGDGSSTAAWSYYHNRQSAFSTDDLESRINPDEAAPDTGMVLVEIYYHYDQILGLASFVGVPDPIELHTYAIMPLSAAEPTPLP